MVLQLILIAGLVIPFGASAAPSGVMCSDNPKIRVIVEPSDTTLARAAHILAKTHECLEQPITDKRRVEADSNRNPSWSKFDREIIVSDGPGHSTATLVHFLGRDPEKGAPYQACLTGCKTGGAALGIANQCPDFCENIRQNEFCEDLRKDLAVILPPPCPRR
jgi:hypothetical protein